ncbi:MAG: L-2-amino-thiazoline-4-carboxylic acid hydrolase [bacterium]|nr:L-2-amino-thiazoline-4-carboxylic acid hydrolase [Myxococcales bacterium]
MTPARRERRAALAALRRHLGAIGALRVALAVDRRLTHAHPFRRLPPPADAIEARRRARVAPAIALFDVLRLRYGDARAIALCVEAVEAAVAVFLDTALGPLDRARLAAMSDAERAAFVHRVERGLPGVVVHVERADHEALRFTVAACALVKLCAEAGCPELAPVFCAGDARFFARLDPAARLDRATTIAGGGPCCPFRVTFGG